MSRVPSAFERDVRISVMSLTVFHAVEFMLLKKRFNEVY